MSPEITKLLERIKDSSPKSPPWEVVSNIIEHANPTVSEWMKLLPIMREHYGFKTNKAVTDAMKITSIKEEIHEDDFLPVIEKAGIKGWIREYINHTQGMEPPSAYQFASACWIISSSLQRQVHLQRGYFTYYPPISTMLIGPSGDGKSTSGDYAFGVMKESGRNFPINGDSKAYLHTMLYENYQQLGEAIGTLYASELADFIGKDDWKTNLIDYLIRLIDGEDITGGVLARKGQDIEKVAVPFLACSNVDQLIDGVPKRVIGSGFLSRFLVFYCEGTNKVCPNPTIPEDAASRDWLLERLKLTTHIKGNITLDPEAESWYDTWYVMKYKTTPPKDERLLPFHNRKRAWILRLGLIFAISEELTTDVETMPPIGSSRYIKQKHLEQAEAILEWIDGKIPKVYQLLASSPFGKEQNKIISVLRNHKRGIEITVLSKKLQMPRTLLKEHLNTLEWNGTIGRTKDNMGVFLKRLGGKK